MDLRVLSYFLAVAREESFSKEAAAIHVSQPTLSRQIAELEAELGKQLFIRGTRMLSLTTEGQFLKKRAQELLSLAEKTETEIRGDMDEISGNIYFAPPPEQEFIINKFKTWFAKNGETFDFYALQQARIKK
jgi:DNA-binding transcriptional LysR family regulator